MKKQKKLFENIPKKTRQRSRRRKWNLSVEEFRAIIGAGDDLLEDRNADTTPSSEHRRKKQNRTPKKADTCHPAQRIVRFE